MLKKDVSTAVRFSAYLVQGGSVARVSETLALLSFLKLLGDR